MSTPTKNSPRQRVNRQRRWITTLVAAYLLIQICLPLRYYLGLAPDERFAWRMFSSTGMSERTITVHETHHDGTRKKLRNFSWVKSMQKSPPVREAFLDWRLKNPDVHSVQIEITSTATDGTELPTLNLEKTNSPFSKPLP